jgi:hypothetical protein
MLQLKPVVVLAEAIIELSTKVRGITAINPKTSDCECWLGLFQAKKAFSEKRGKNPLGLKEYPGNTKP